MNDQTLDVEMFSDIEQQEVFSVEEIHYEEPELYNSIIKGVV